MIKQIAKFMLVITISAASLLSSSVTTATFYNVASTETEQSINQTLEAFEIPDTAESLMCEKSAKPEGENARVEEKQVIELGTAIINESDYKPGYHMIDGHIVFIKQNGKAARNENVGVMAFDENGVYTTGDAELDELLTQFFIDASAEDYEYGSLEQLKAMYMWVVRHYGYRKAEMIDAGTHGWGNDRAKAMLSTRKGNCYMYAALVYQVSKALGYEPTAYSGKMVDNKPHGWVEIEFDGEPYIFDAEICYQQYTYKNNYNCDFFKQNYWVLRYWEYTKLGADVQECI